MNDIVLSDLMKHAFGFHTLPSQVDRIRRMNQAFPPYNIIVDNEEDPKHFELEVAIAGFSKEDITVKTRVERGVTMLVIEGAKGLDGISGQKESRKFLAHGLATRSFKREFTVADGVKVDAVSIANGILSIKLSYDQDVRGEKILHIEG